MIIEETNHCCSKQTDQMLAARGTPRALSLKYSAEEPCGGGACARANELRLFWVPPALLEPAFVCNGVLDDGF